LWEGLELTASGATTLERLGNQVGTRYVRDGLDQVQAATPTAYAVSVRDKDWAGWGSPASSALRNQGTTSFDAGVQAFSAAFDGVSGGAIRYEVGLSRNARSAMTALCGLFAHEWSDGDDDRVRAFRRQQMLKVRRVAGQQTISMACKQRDVGVDDIARSRLRHELANGSLIAG
jgi:hypothetical protein